MQPSLQIKNCQLYRQNELLLSLNEQVKGGEILTIMGPSGSGKSSLLNWLTGTLPTGLNATGEVWLNDTNISCLPSHLRHVAVLYQDPLLFSHLSVGGNISFAMPKMDKTQRQQQIDQALTHIGLKGITARSL